MAFSCTVAALRRHLAGETEQVLDNLLGALGLLQDHAQIAARTLGQSVTSPPADRRNPEWR